MQIDYRGVGLAQIFESFVFALFIGIDEDLFSRGFAFGVIERYGVWIAAILSSLQFGLLHLGNFVWGGQSAVYTIGQAISAGAFGFLAAALMVYSGSILVPILMHGLCDMPMQFETAAQYTKKVTGKGEAYVLGRKIRPDGWEENHSLDPAKWAVRSTFYKSQIFWAR